MDADYHIHTASSDGPTLHEIMRAASEEGLSEVGIVDHCNVSPYNDIGYSADMFEVEGGDFKGEGSFSEDVDLRDMAVREFVDDEEYVFFPGEEFDRPERYVSGESVVEPGFSTGSLQEENPIVIWQGVEMDYEPDDEPFITSYLGSRDFDYSIGSVHYLQDRYVPKEKNFPGQTSAEAEELTERYFDKMVSLVESEIFDILAHPGLIERNPVFEPHVVSSHYEDVAQALKKSETITEINGKSLERQQPPYPVEVFVEEGVTDFTTGTDTHREREIGERSGLVDDKLKELNAVSIGAMEGFGSREQSKARRERAV